ncbi:MAG: type II secretion system F family protein [Desulfuromonas sp.]|nr:MAG: type II secretion system F family protein [Desulfuromonas sp.]
MPTFQCKLGSADGRVIDREFEASSRELLQASLEEQGFHVFQIQKRPFQFLKSKGAGWGGRRFLSFNQEFLVLLKAGLPILQTLDALLERHEGGAARQVLQEVREDIRGGNSVSESFAKFPHFFPLLYVASIKAGERTGDLPVTLSRYIEYQKRVEAIKAKVKNASFYPAMLSFAVIAVLVFLLVYVVPSFTSIYSDANVDLPLITVFVMSLADWVIAALPFFVPLLIAVVPLLRWFLQSEKGGLIADRLILRVPFLGNLAREYALLSFCRTLGTTLLSGIPVVEALKMSRGTLNNRILELAMVQAIQRVEEGENIGQAFEGSGIFPGLALRMIAVGEKGGALAQMLEDVAAFYESEVERRLDRMTTLVEPIMMASMGLLIGGVVVAMYIPIFQLGGVVAG